MPALKRLALLCWFVMMACARPAGAQTSGVPPMPKDMAGVDFYLLTVGRGAQIEALFGHTIIRAIDRSNGQDIAFNWGIFEFNGPGFVWNFYQGNLTYMLGIYDTSALIDFYRNVEHRSMVQQRLVLTLKQKTALMQRFIRNALPANVSYQYSQLRDNCATRPRDHLDAVLHGKISEAFHDRPAATTYRRHMTSSSAPVWWVNMGLDILTNDVLDRPISNWEEMFLPLRLQQLLALLPAYDDDGKALSGQTLLTDPVYLIDLPDPLPGPNPYSMWLLLVGGPLSLLLLAVWRRPLAARSARWLGVVCLVFGCWSAFWATLFTCNWLFSRYIEATHNSLLWLLWPLDWIFVYYGLKLIRKRSLPGRDSRLGRLVRGLSLLHVAALVCAALLWMAQLIHQDILPELASFGAFGTLFYVTISCLGAAQGSRPSDA